MRHRGARKRARHAGADGPAARPQPALEPGLSCPTLTDGRRFRILAIVDDFTRECLHLVADTSLPGLRSRMSSTP